VNSSILSITQSSAGPSEASFPGANCGREQRRALNLLKLLTNELKIVIVAVGTSDAFHALQTDVQVASRFEHR
jgi:hypothetical protein